MPVLRFDFEGVGFEMSNMCSDVGREMFSIAGRVEWREKVGWIER